MTKLTILFYFLIYTNLSSCQQPTKQKTKFELTKPQKGLQQGIQKQKKTIPLTNKDPKNDEWNNNIYRNKFYKFRIEFPKGWEYDKGSTKITIARAGNREIGAVFAVTVSHLAFKPKNPNDITKEDSTYLDKKFFNERLALQNKKAENFKVQKGYLNNFPAYLIEFTHVVLSGTRRYIYLAKQVECYQDSKLYTIALNLPLEAYDDEMDNLYNRVVASFNFEIAY